MNVDHVVDGATQALANRAFAAGGHEGVQHALDAVLERLQRRRLPAAMAEAAVEAVAARTPTRQQLRLVEALVSQAARHDPDMQALVDRLGVAVTHAADVTINLRQFESPRVPSPRHAEPLMAPPPDPVHEPISWELDVPVRLAVAPGRPGRLEGQLFNLTPLPMRVTLQVRGEAADVVKVPSRVDLPAHGHALVPVTIHPTTSAPLAGSYTPSVVVGVEGADATASRTELRFTVDAAPQVRLTWPPSLPLGDFGADADPMVVTFTNTGNTPFHLGARVETEGRETQEWVRPLAVGAQEQLRVPDPPRARVFTTTRRMRVTAEDRDRSRRLEVADRLVPVPPMLPVERRHLRVAGGLAAFAVAVGVIAAMNGPRTADPAVTPAPAAVVTPAPDVPRAVPAQALPACPGVNDADVAPAAVSPSPPPAAQALIGGAVFDGVNPGGKYLVVGSDDHRVHAFDPDTLEPVWWSSCLSGPIAAQPVVLDAGTTVHAVSADGTVATFALDAKGEQEPLRTAKVHSTASMKPSKASRFLLVTSGKSRETVTLLDARTYDVVTSLKVDGDLRQNPQSVHARRIYLANGSSHVSAYDLPQGTSRSLKEREPLESGASALSLDYVSVPAREAEASEGDGTESVIAAGTVEGATSAPGRLLFWASPSGPPRSAKLPGTPAARLGVSAAGDTVFVAQRSGEKVLLSRVQPDSPDDVRTVTLPVPAGASPTTRPGRISSPQLAGSTVALAYGHCLYAGPTDLSRLAPVFCTDADIQGPPALSHDGKTGVTTAYVAGRDGRLSRIDL